jgi:16S rRNA (guanine966-N2)-methyltransferase
MRIVGGQFGRRTIEAPPGRDTRPTTDRVREALFSLLGSRLEFEDARVVDLFAGSGALGLEAISRGAAHATFVERHGPSLGVARRNAATLGVTALCSFVRADVLVWLRRPSHPADLILADPPYDFAALADLPALVLPHLCPGGWLALEHDTRHDLEQEPGVVTARSYGQTVVSLFEKEEPGVMDQPA